MGGNCGKGGADALGLVLREECYWSNKALGNRDSRDFVVVFVGGVGGVPVHVEVTMFVMYKD